MIDTQILVHMIGGRRPAIQGAAVASVSAKEFLIAYGPEPHRARYYVPLARGLHGAVLELALADRPSNHASRRVVTDRMVIDFNNEHPSIVEFSDQALSAAINQGRTAAFASALRALEKAEQRSLRRRFRFLVDQRFRCYALEQEAVEAGLAVLDRFLDSNNPKSDFRNTVRDALILGTAFRHGMPLQTEDKLLAREAAKLFGAPILAEDDGLVLDFERAAKAASFRRQESKGYINRGWRIAVEGSRPPR